MSNPMIAIATITDDEAAQLAEMRHALRRVHKSAPPSSPARRASQELSDKLQQFHRRGVPLHTLARVVGLSHQAVRVRVRNAETPASAANPIVAPMLSAPTADVVLVADSGVHRRLHVHDDPEESASTMLAMSPKIPLLKTKAQVITWLESEAPTESSRRSFTATRLRVPPLVYVPRSVVNTVLTPLTDDDVDGET